MMIVSSLIAKEINAQALITGENVGQVASQTLSNINVISDASDMPILRPLVGYNKKDIINLAIDIGTYEISILPYEDCCGFFVPKHPETKSKIDIINPKTTDLIIMDDKSELVKLTLPERTEVQKTMGGTL